MTMLNLDDNTQIDTPRDGRVGSGAASGQSDSLDNERTHVNGNAETSTTMTSISQPLSFLQIKSDVQAVQAASSSSSAPNPRAPKQYLAAKL